jgi:hypothetical protein
MQNLWIQMVAGFQHEGKAILIHTTNWPIYILLSVAVGCLVALVVLKIFKMRRVQK